MIRFSWRTTILSALALMAACVPDHSNSAPSDVVTSAVSFCRGKRNAIVASDDKRIVCFEGRIDPRNNLEPISSLATNGIFVIRSVGGNVATAMKIADILLEKNALVVIYDYCYSACANYIFVATPQIYVRRDAIIAWHGGPPNRDCDAAGERLTWRLGIGAGKEALENFEQRVCDIGSIQNGFFSKRGIEDRFIYRPQTNHTRRHYKLLTTGNPGHRNVFWMWNPRNYGDFFKTKITYERYPESQDEVDNILARFRQPPRVLYDP